MLLPHNHKGFGPILIAMGVLSFLGTLALVNNLQTLIMTKRATEKVLRLEGFYNGELSVWHGYYRAKAGLTLTGTPDAKGRYVASFEANYEKDLPTLPEESYSPESYEEGVPLHVGTTKEYDKTKTILRHVNSELLRVTPKDANGTYCGSSVFARKGRDYKTCLWEKPVIGAPPASSGWRRLIANRGYTCFLRASGELKCWGEAANMISMPASMCARKSSYLLAGTSDDCGVMRSSPADVNSSSASYRVLRGGRQRPSRSVDREAVGRNASAAIELRHMMNRVWVPRLYVLCEGNTSLTGRPTGVREHSMLPKQVGEPRRSDNWRRETVATHFTRTKFKEVGRPISEVRSLHCSDDVGSAQ